MLLVQPAEASDGDWWNSSWHYSIRVDVNSSVVAATNVSISGVSVNFTQQLSQLNSTGTFLPESIRVMENGGYEVPFDFVNSTHAQDAGNLSWIAEGSVNSTVNRTFYIYFDVSRSGTKVGGRNTTERPNWRSGYVDDMDVNSQTWNRSWAIAAEVSWNWSTEAFADYAYLYANGVQASTKDGATSGETAIYQGNSFYSRFSSDELSSYPDYGAADAYGVYGAAVNWVRFLPVRAYSTQAVTRTIAQARAQPTTLSLNSLPEGRDYNEAINVNGTVTDAASSPIYNASVTVAVFLGSDLKWSTTVQTNTSGQYSTSTQALWDVNGTYSVNVTASKQDYASSSNQTAFYYTADSAPSLGLVSVNSTSTDSYTVGWGENITYAVNVSDLDNHGDTISVTLWVNTSSGWSSQQTKTATIANNATQERLYWNLTSLFNYTDISGATPKAYKFEYFDSFHSSGNTSQFQGPIVEADDIALDFVSGNSSVNRSGTSYIKFEARLKDSDSGNPLPAESLSFWNFYSGMAIPAGSNSTNANGTAAVWADPTCSSETGVHWWKANYTNSTSYYKSASSSQFYYTVIGTLGGSLAKPGGGAYAQGDIVPMEFNLTDDCSSPVSGQSSVNFTIWKSGSAPNYCTGVDNGGGIHNCTWDSTGMAAGNYSVNASSADSFDLPYNASYLNRFTLTTGPPRVTRISVVPSAIAELVGAVRINATVMDQSGSGIGSVFANVTLPSGTIFRRSMDLTASSGSSYNYTILYNSSWGSTTERGLYGIVIYATDNLAISGSAISNFTAYSSSLNATIGVNAAYSQGQFGSVRLNVSDDGGNPTSGASASLSIIGPLRTKLYFLSGKTGTTDQYGTLEETPVFVVPSDSPTGVYTINVTLLYNETLMNGGTPINASFFGNFTVGGQQSGSLYAKISADTRQFLGHEMTISALVYSSTSPVEPDQLTLSLYFILPNGALSQWFNVSMSGMNRSSAGIYTLTYPVPSSSAYATSYLLTLNATSGSLSAVDAAQMRIVQGGPYDVSISQLGEARAGEYLTFDLNLTNKGDVDNFDVNVSYWFGSNPRTLESVQVNAHAYNVLTNRRVFIPSGTTTGYYNLTAEVVYDSNSAAAYATRPFLVIASTATPSQTGSSSTTGGGGSTGAPAGLTSSSFAPAPPEKSPKMAISSYPKEILAEKGWIKTENIEINNTGELPLHEISLSFDGVPAAWIDATSTYLPLLAVGSVASFRITIAVPISTKSSSYPFLIKATSRESYDEKNAVVKVFASEAELLLYQMETLRSRISSAEKKIAVMERNGMNVTVAKATLAGAQAQMGFADKYWSLEIYDRTLSIIRDTETIMDSLEYELELVTSSFKPQDKKPAVEIFPASGLMLGIGAAVLAAIILMSAWVLKMARVMDSVLRVRAMSELKNIVIGRKAEIDVVRGDGAKIQWLLSTIEKQYKNGLISKETYEELKAQNEKKLSNIKAAIGP